MEKKPLKRDISRDESAAWCNHHDTLRHAQHDYATLMHRRSKAWCAKCCGSWVKPSQWLARWPSHGPRPRKAFWPWRLGVAHEPVPVTAVVDGLIGEFYGEVVDDRLMVIGEFYRVNEFWLLVTMGSMMMFGKDGLNRTVVEDWLMIDFNDWLMVTWWLVNDWSMVLIAWWC